MQYYNVSESLTRTTDDVTRGSNVLPRPRPIEYFYIYSRPIEEEPIKPDPPPKPRIKPKRRKLHGEIHDHGYHLRFKRMI